MREYMGVIRYEKGQNGVSLDRVTTLYRPPEAIQEIRETMISPIDTLAFSYGDAGEAGQGSVVWNGAWNNPSNFPVAVSIVIGVREEGKHVEQRQVVVLSRR